MIGDPSEKGASEKESSRTYFKENPFTFTLMLFIRNMFAVTNRETQHPRGIYYD